MSQEIASIRNKTRRLKDLAMTQAIDILENKDKYSPQLWEATFLKVIGNAVPRSTEITGEDGGAMIIEISKEIAEKNAINSIAGSNS